MVHNSGHELVRCLIRTVAVADRDGSEENDPAPKELQNELVLCGYLPFKWNITRPSLVVMYVDFLVC